MQAQSGGKIGLGCRTKELDGSAQKLERRVALGFSQKVSLKAGCKPALQLFCHTPIGPGHTTSYLAFLAERPLCPDLWAARQRRPWNPRKNNF
jgi:hypothetical protein